MGQLGLLFLAWPRLTQVPLNAFALTEWYRSASKATVVMENHTPALLPLVVPRISLPFMATTTPSAHKFPNGSEAYMMYCGALVYLVFLFYTPFFGSLMPPNLRQIPGKRANQTPIEFGGQESFTAIGLIVVNTFYNWVGNWPFWVGFVRLSGDLYVSVLVLGPRLLECF